MTYMCEHSRFGFSAVDTYRKCPRRYYLEYIQKVEREPNYEANNPLVIGTALHRGVETDIQTAVQEYVDYFPVLTDLMENEIMKLEILISKVKDLLVGVDVIHETKVVHGSFIGTLDLLEKTGEGVYNLYDMKYSNNVDGYMDSMQLHLYRYFFELSTGNRVDRMYYIFIPKTGIRQKKTEDLFQFRQRLRDTVNALNPLIVEVPFSPEKVNEYYGLVEKLEADTEFRCPENGCRYCMEMDVDINDNMGYYERTKFRK